MKNKNKLEHSIFEYEEYKRDTFWDFNWEDDKWTIIEILALAVFCAWVVVKMG